MTDMNTVHPESKARARMRNLGAALFSVAVGIAMTASAMAADTITLRHSARSREGFARGALKAAQWIVGKQGVYEFSDVLFTKR